MADHNPDDIGAIEPALEAAVEAILDDAPPDWRRATDSAGGLDEQLKIIEQIAAVHRQLGLRPEQDPGTSEGGRMWGHLRLLDRVGEGTFGEVFRAWDLHLDREVALKLLRARPGIGALRSGILEEARLLASIRHPNVVTVFGADRIDEQIGFWTEFIDGETLAARVDLAGPSGEDDAIRIVLDVCRAVGAVHDAGLLHRDIKATNVMIDRAGRVVLLDFGASRLALADAAVRGEPTSNWPGPTGTPVYAAPELWDGVPASRQSDVYSIGVLLFFLLTGQYPVDGVTPADVIASHRRGARRQLAVLRPRARSALREVVERALASSPADRFATVQDLERALVAVCIAKPRWRRAIRVVAIVLLAATLAVATYVGSQRREEPPSGVQAADAAASRSVSAPAAQRAPTPDTKIHSATPGVIAPPASRPVPELTKIATPVVGVVWSKPSLDGKYYAYIDVRGTVGVWDVARNRTWTVRDAGSTGGEATSVMMSRAGDRVAYVWKYPDQSYDLQVAHRDGSQPTILLPRRTAVQPVLRDWSQQRGDLLCWLLNADKRADLALLPTDGAPHVVVYSKTGGAAHAAISPDGRFVVFDRAVTPAQLQTVILRVGDRDVDVIDETGGTPEWTADGRHVLVMRRSSTAEIARDAWLLPIANGRPTGPAVRIGANVAALGLPAFPTRDGRLLTIGEQRFNETFALTFDPVLGRVIGAATRLIAQELEGHASPSWSPDGKTVAFFRMRQHPVPGVQPQGDLSLLDVRSETTTRVAPRLAWQGTYSPQWMPDGQHLIVWASDTDSPARRGWYRVDVRTGAATALRLFEDGDLIPEKGVKVLPDGTGFLYVDPRGIVARRFDGREEVIVKPPDAQELDRFAISKNGSLAFGVRTTDGRSAIRLRSPDGVVQDIVQGGVGDWLQPVSWLPDGSRVLFLYGRLQSASRELGIVNVDGSDRHDVGLRIPVQGGQISLSPDGTRLLYPDRVITQQLWARVIRSASGRR